MLKVTLLKLKDVDLKKVIVKDYNDTESTKQMRETVKAYNAFLHNTYIDASTLDEPFYCTSKV